MQRQSLFTCAHCGQPHVTEIECQEHQAECLWDKRSLLYDPQVHGCHSCGNLERSDGMYCAAKGGALVTVPVTLCRFWIALPKPVPVGQAQAQAVA